MPELVPRVQDVGRQVLPRVGLLLGRLDVVVDVVEVDPGEISAPGRQRPGEEVVERLVAHLPHPVRLVLVLRDRLDDLVRDPPARLEEVVLRLVRVREPVLHRVVGADPLTISVSVCADHKPPLPFNAKLDPDPRERAILERGEPTYRSVPEKNGPASRTLFASVPHLARADGASMPLGLGRRPDTQGQSDHPTRFKTNPRSLDFRQLCPAGARCNASAAFSN